MTVECPLDCKIKPVNPKVNKPWIFIGRTDKLKLHLMERANSLERPWCWARLKAGGEGDDRGWDGWMASPTQWTWVSTKLWETMKNREAWSAAVHGITKSQTRLSDWITTTFYINVWNFVVTFIKLIAIYLWSYLVNCSIFLTILKLLKIKFWIESFHRQTNFEVSQKPPGKSWSIFLSPCKTEVYLGLSDMSNYVASIVKKEVMMNCLSVYVYRYIFLM